MMVSSKITHVHARQILDSRGRPTVEADVHLADGSCGRAAVPSGASTGRYESVELRDGDACIYEGRGVLRAVSHVNNIIAKALIGHDATAQADIDGAMATLDPSLRFETLGANAVLAVSMAVCRAAANARHVPLFQHIAGISNGLPVTIPMPMTNILSGGAHAGRSMDIQDFLAIPIGAQSYDEALGMLVRVRETAALLMSRAGLTTLLADEGGLAPGYVDPREALDLMVRAFEAAGLRPGTDIAITLDVAASELFDGKNYQLHRAGLTFSSAELIDYVSDLVDSYPIVSVEDLLDQDDWAGWVKATRRLPHIQLVGDDLFVTNQSRITEGAATGAGNSVLIKVNQNGTLTGTFAAMSAARAAGYSTIVSARSGETEDSFLADLAVGTGGGQIKIGSVRNSERLAKYNQLLRISEDRSIAFAGFKTPQPNGAVRAFKTV